MDPSFLQLEEVLEIHRDQIARYGGGAGVRDLGLLESALAMPQAGVAGRYLHGDLFEMAAAYLFHVVKNHPFVDGNKRVGAAAALVFMEMNGREVRMPDDALIALVLDVVGGRLQKHGVAEVFRRYARA